MKIETAVIVVILVIGFVIAWRLWGENIGLITGGSYSATSTTEIKANTISLALGDVLFLKTPRGDRGAIRFDRMTHDWGADYTSWFISAESTGPPVVLQGHVFEKYWKTREQASTQVKDIGGNYGIRCGSLTIGWSASTWLYIPNGYSFAVSTKGKEGYDQDQDALEWLMAHDEEKPKEISR